VGLRSFVAHGQPTVARPVVDDVIARARARVAATGVQIDAESTLAARGAERRR
jgi:hypothetical protein